MCTLLGVLQNAWREDGRPYASREEWLEGLWHSHTGRRLREMLPEDVDFEVVNSTARVGDNPASRLSPDRCHVAEMIGTHCPRRGRALRPGVLG
jgi:hypothetical protein